jgi:probable F420-dependent oxidoreductase
VGKLREQLAALRAFWAAWQHGEPLNLRGDYYKLSLMTPFFAPPPIQHPEIPIYLAGVNTALAKLAGEAADGFLVHPFHSPEYLREVLLPAIRRGAEGAERAAGAVDIVVNAFVATNAEERESIRQQLAFYASTPSYRRVLAQHGFDAVGAELSKLAARKRWEAMPGLVSDTMLETFATLATAEELADALRARYAGLGDRLALYLPFVPGERDGFWRQLTGAFNQG